MQNKSLVSRFLSYLLISLLPFPILTTISCSSRSQEASGENRSGNVVSFYIGSYTGENDPGIFLYEYDMTGSGFKKIQEVSGQNNPSFLAIHPEEGFLYAVNQTADYEGKNEGSVSAFSIDANSGELTFLNRQSSLGSRPCHVSITPDGRHVAVANYTGGSIAILPVSAGGSLEKASGFVQHEGSGPNERRQRGPHAHSIYPSLCGSYIFSADLGIDKVMIYKLDNTGNLHPNQLSPFAGMDPGAGPRHLAIHPNGEWIYVVNELNSTITRLTFDTSSGRASVMETLSTLPEGFDEVNYCADIHVHPGGRFLYASNRGHNSIAVFELSPNGTPRLISNELVRGEWPRNFNIDPSGRLLFAANQNTGNITVFDIDPATGLLNYRGDELKINQPVCIVFLTR
jgi:6-phosphogluconolactonase